MSFRFFSRVFFIVSIAVVAMVSSLTAKDSEGSQKRDKARYFYLKGSQSLAEGADDEAYEYFKKAAQIDPAYDEAGYQYGFLRSGVMIDTLSSQTELRRDLQLMKNYVESHPFDIDATERYAYVAVQADTIPEGLRVFKRLVDAKPSVSRLYLGLSYYYLQTGNPDSAVMALREYERLEGATNETTFRKMGSWLSAGDTVKALAEIDEYVASNPHNPRALIDKGTAYNILGKPDTALYFMEEAMREFPDNSDIKATIAFIYEEQGDTARFHSLIGEALRGDDFEYEDKRALLNTYFDHVPLHLNDYSASDANFEYMAELYPDDADILDIYAVYEVKKGNLKKAMDIDFRAIELQPSDPTFLGRGITLSVMVDNPEKGIKAFEESDSAMKKIIGVQTAYLSALVAVKDYNKALQWIDTVISQYAPGLSHKDVIKAEDRDSLVDKYGKYEIYSLAAWFEDTADIYTRMGKNDEALRCFENAVVLAGDDNALTLNNFAYFIVDKLKEPSGTELFDRAKEMSRRSLELTEDNPLGTYYDTYAWILFKEQNYKEALDYMETAIDLEGETVGAELFSHYGDILFMNGRPEDAVIQWQKALDITPDDQLLRKKVEHKTFFFE